MNSLTSCIDFPRKSFLTASSAFGRLLITSANSLDVDQYRQNVGRDMYPNRLTLKYFFDEKNIFEKCQKKITKSIKITHTQHAKR